MRDNRPNYLFIITDQHRADYLGCYGHPFLNTPTIDGLAARGTRFERFYVASPVCMPNRASLMTGRLPSVTGARGNGLPLTLQANTFVDLLRAAGYRTALCGKSHLQNMTDYPALYEHDVPAGLQAPAGDLGEALKAWAPAVQYDQEKPSRWARQRQQMALPFYGYERVHLCTGHGDMVGADYLHWVRDKGQEPLAIRGREHAHVSTVVAPQAWRTAIPEDLYPTTYVAECALACLDDWSREGRDTPFFLTLSFPDPHHPFTPPGKYWDMYSPNDVVLPESFYAERAEELTPVERARSTASAPHFDPERSMVFLRPDERQTREAIALTCGMISMIDDVLARVMTRLAALRQIDNTVIVFTADHGDFLGDHGLLLKGPLHLQGLIRVPFIWCDPARPGGRGLESLSSTIDIAPTVLARAGLAGFNGMQGRNLLPDIDTGTDTGPGCVIIDEESQRALLGLPAPVRVRSMVTEDWRLTVYDDARLAEMYDLKHDPYELRNRWNDPLYRAQQATLTERLLRRSIHLLDRSPLPLNRA